MRKLKLYLIYIISSVFITLAIAGWLTGLVPRDPIDWVFTGPLLLCPLPALFLSRHDKYRFRAIIFSTIITYTGFIWYFADGFYQLGYWATWITAAIYCYKRDQWEQLYVTTALVGFGALMLICTGVSVPETTLWSIGWNIFYQVVWAPPVVLWMIERDPKTKAEISHQSDRREHRAAA